MAVTTVNLSDTISAWVTKTNTISTDLGDRDSLTTAATDIVQAINNIETRIDAVGINSPFNVNNDSADGLSISFDSDTGTLSLSGGADATTVRSYLVAGDGLDYDSSGGIFSVGDGEIVLNMLGDSSVASGKLANTVSLTIYNSSGTAVKTLYGAGI